MRRYMISFKILAAAVVGLILTWLVLVPMALLVLSAFKPTGLIQDPGLTFAHIYKVYTDPDFWVLTLNTFEFAIGAALFALVAGGVLAWLVERTDMPGRRFFRSFAVLPMVMPPFLLAMAWVMLLSPRTGMLNHFYRMMTGASGPLFDINSIAGMIFVEGLAIIPSAFLILSPAMRNIDSSLEEAAYLSGASTWRVLRRVLFPLLRPAFLAAAIYLFVVCCIVFDVPGAIGMPSRIYVIATKSYSLLNDNPSGLPDYATVSAMGLMFIAILIGLALLYQRMTRQGSRYVTVSGKNFWPRLTSLGRWRYVAFAGVSVYFVAAIFLPLAILVWTSLMPYLVRPSFDVLKLLTLRKHVEFLNNPMALEAGLNSLIIALMAGTAVAALSLAVAWLVNKSKVPGRKILDIVSFLPLATPGVLMAVALMYVYLYFNGFGVYGTIWIVAIAYTTVFLGFGSRSMLSSVTQIHPELEEAAQTCGASPFLTIRRVIVPLALPALGAVWLWVFSHSLRELGAALTLQGLSNSTVPTVLYSYWSSGQPNLAAVVGVWLLIALIVTILVANFIGAKMRRGA